MDEADPDILRKSEKLRPVVASLAHCWFQAGPPGCLATHDSRDASDLTYNKANLGGDEKPGRFHVEVKNLFNASCCQKSTKRAFRMLGMHSMQMSLTALSDIHS